MIKQQIKEKLSSVLAKMGIENAIPELEHPANNAFGDYSTSIALKLTKELKKNPLAIAEEISGNFPKDDLIAKTEAVKPGFVNFWLTNNYLTQSATQLAQGAIDYPRFHLGPHKKVMVEFAHPNTHKLFHIGHLRNIATGEAIVRILEAVGNKVIRVNYQGDVGLHIAKCLYGIKHSKINLQDLKTLPEKIKFIGEMYTVGTRAYGEDERAKEEIIEINKKIYEQDPQIMPLWTETRQWSLDYYDVIYRRVDSHFDHFYFESELPKRGTELANLALEKGILERSEGAIVFPGKKYGLDTRVFINKLGYPTYEGKELALAETQLSEFGKLDKTIHVVTPEQTSFFKVTFKVEELLDPQKYQNKRYHLVYEWVKLKSGKMSSREGNIIEGPWLLDETKKKIRENFKCDDAVGEILAVASVKYSFLKSGVDSQIAFDINESISLEGNSGPYLLYTYVRTQSVMNKADLPAFSLSHPPTFAKEESDLLRMLYQFPEVVGKAAANFAPSAIANYLYDVAQKFNIFYQQCPILKADEETKNFRLMLTKATATVLKQGLYLLGIRTVDKM